MKSTYKLKRGYRIQQKNVQRSDQAIYNEEIQITKNGLNSVQTS